MKQHISYLILFTKFVLRTYYCKTTAHESYFENNSFSSDTSFTQFLVSTSMLSFV